ARHHSHRGGLPTPTYCRYRAPRIGPADTPLRTTEAAAGRHANNSATLAPHTELPTRCLADRSGAWRRPACGPAAALCVAAVRGDWKRGLPSGMLRGRAGLPTEVPRERSTLSEADQPC